MTIEARIRIGPKTSQELGHLAARMGWTERKMVEVAIRMASKAKLDDLMETHRSLIVSVREASNDRTRQA
jgi:hypothetical protein